MLKLLFSALSLILAGVILLVVGLVPAVLSGMAWGSSFGWCAPHCG